MEYWKPKEPETPMEGAMTRTQVQEAMKKEKEALPKVGDVFLLRMGVGGYVALPDTERSTADGMEYVEVKVTAIKKVRVTIE